MLHLEQPQYSDDMPLYEQFIRDWDAFNNNEPFWSAMHALDLKQHDGRRRPAARQPVRHRRAGRGRSRGLPRRPSGRRGRPWPGRGLERLWRMESPKHERRQHRLDRPWRAPRPRASARHTSTIPSSRIAACRSCSPSRAKCRCCKERLDTVERLLDAKGTISRADIEAYAARPATPPMSAALMTKEYVARDHARRAAGHGSDGRPGPELPVERSQPAELKEL